MSILRVARFASLAFAVVTPSFAFADYTYQETTQITGGSLLRMMKLAGHFSSQARKAGEPITSSVYLKGNRLARVSQDSVEIIDLDKEAITNIDTLKHTYTVMTFQQMRDQMAKAVAEAKKEQAKAPKAQEAPPPPEQNDVKISFDVKVRDTGAQKQISGLSAKEAILTMAAIATDQKTQQSGSMAVTNDMWLVPEVPGYSQVTDFYVRFAEKMGPMVAGLGLEMSRMLAQNPGATNALEDMGKEMRKIKGVPIMQVMRMGTTTDGKPLPAASEAPLPADNGPAMPSGSDIAKQSAASMISSKLSGFGFGKKKKDADDAPKQDAQPAQQPTSAVLMETQVSTSNFSSDPVDESHFAVPAGYKQLQPQGQ